MGKLKVNHRNKSHPNCLAEFKTIHKNLLSHSALRERWNSKVPSPEAFGEVVTRYEAAYEAARNGDRVYIALRNNIRNEATALLEKMAPYLEVELADEPMELMTLGFEVKRERNSNTKMELGHPTNFQVINAPKSGVLIASATRVVGAACYQAYVAERDPSVEENWRHLAVFPRASKMVITDLEPGKNYFFRLRAIGNDGPGPWSNPVTTIVT